MLSGLRNEYIHDHGRPLAKKLRWKFQNEKLSIISQEEKEQLRIHSVGLDCMTKYIRFVSGGGAMFPAYDDGITSSLTNELDFFVSFFFTLFLPPFHIHLSFLS